MEDFSRKLNIVVDGLPESREENDEQLQAKIKRLLAERFQVESNFDVVHRLGSMRDPSNERPRSVIVRFKELPSRQACMRSSAKLKGTNIYLNEDLSKASMDILRSKLDELHEKRRQG